jgi:hypothetical protein
MEMRKNVIFNISDGLLFIVIILSLFHIFIEDFSVFMGFSKNVLINIHLINIFFDTIYTVEFLCKLLFSIYSNKSAKYIFYERGWIDFIVSIPLLLLISMPLILESNMDFKINIWIYSFPYSVQFLRFLRILKFIKIQKFKNSMFYENQIKSISIITVFSIIFFLTIIRFFQENGVLLNVFINVQQMSFYNLIYFSLIMFVLFSIFVFFGRQLKLYAVNPINEILKGFDELYYTKEVKIPKNYIDDEIFLLADNYNKKWLPAKIRKLKEIKSKGLTIVNISKKGRK